MDGKKFEYSRPVSLRILPSPGFKTETINYLNTLSANLWIPPKFPITSRLSGKFIHTTGSYYSIIEIWFRSLFAMDMLSRRSGEWVSLSGEPMYKRGYREPLANSAPLREDLAYHLLAKGMEPQTPNILWIPFSGTGTFAWEYLSLKSKISFGNFPREFAFEDFTNFKPDFWKFLKNQSLRTQEPVNDVKIILQDTDMSTIEYCKTIESKLKAEKLFQFSEIEYKDSNFISEPIENSVYTSPDLENQLLYLPLNPPYGMRMSMASVESIYHGTLKRILDGNRELKKRKCQQAGFLICPTEKLWAISTKALSKEFGIQTHHFMHGGKEMRALYFQ